MANAFSIPRLARTEAEPLLATIGNTPLLRLEKIQSEFPGIEIYAKAEFFNPGGSVKDRAALNMILDGERSGKLTQNRTILDATSGNTGIAYAMIGADRGLQGEAVPAGERLARAQADPEGLRRGDGFHRSRRRLRRRDPHVPRDLRGRSGPLLLSRTSTTIRPTGRRTSKAPAPRSSSRPTARITHFVAGMGTSGTFMGVTRRLQRDMPDVKCYLGAAVDRLPRPGRPEAHADRHRARHSTTTQLADDNLWIETEDAYAMVRRLAREEGLLVGISSGATCTPPRCWRANWRKRGETGVIVTILCDSADKYLSEHFWDEE